MTIEQSISSQPLVVLFRMKTTTTSSHLGGFFFIFLCSALLFSLVNCRDCAPYDTAATHIATEVVNCLEREVQDILQRNIRKSLVIQDMENKIASLQRMFRSFQTNDVIGRRLFNDRPKGQRSQNRRRSKETVETIDKMDDVVASYGGFDENPTTGTGVSNNNANANTNDVKQALETSNVNYNAVSPSGATGITLTTEQFNELLRALTAKNPAEPRSYYNT